MAKNSGKSNSNDSFLNFDGKFLPLHPPHPVEVIYEIYDKLPLFNFQEAPWKRGCPLRGVMACECTQKGILDPKSVKVYRENGKRMKEGKDYQLDPVWGIIGRLENSRIGEKDPVRISYRYFPSRIDSVVRKSDGSPQVIQGIPSVTLQQLPELNGEYQRLANLFFQGSGGKPADPILYRIQEEEFPWETLPVQSPPPRFMDKLHTGKPVRILAWGDSVTDGSYLPEEERWQNQFSASLTGMYPEADIELKTVAWPGQTMSAFFAEKSGSPYNFQEKILDAKPDLVISEFVNDAALPQEKWQENYSRTLSVFRKHGIEWIILTPHYIHPDWMNFPDSFDLSEDPRPYVKFLRRFAGEHRIPLADTSLLYGHLKKEGIPYVIFMVNGINHPDKRGMKLFHDALLQIFRRTFRQND